MPTDKEMAILFLLDGLELRPTKERLESLKPLFLAHYPQWTGRVGEKKVQRVAEMYEKEAARVKKLFRAYMEGRGWQIA